jgi:hypothetical protein
MACTSASATLPAETNTTKGWIQGAGFFDELKVAGSYQLAYTTQLCHSKFLTSPLHSQPFQNRIFVAQVRRQWNTMMHGCCRSSNNKDSAIKAFYARKNGTSTGVNFPGMEELHARPESGCRYAKTDHVASSEQYCLASVVVNQEDCQGAR